MRTKEFRRFMKSTKLEKRIKNFYYNTDWWSGHGVKSYADYRTKVLKGEKDAWLRNTGVPCSCYSCSGYYKYVRDIKGKVDKEINSYLI